MYTFSQRNHMRPVLRRLPTACFVFTVVYVFTAFVLAATLHAQTTRLTSPAWSSFATAAARYDSLQQAIRVMQEKDPSLKTDQAALQARLAPDMARIQEIIQALSPLARTATAEAVAVGTLSLDDLQVVKLAAQASNTLPLMLECNTRMLTLVRHADSLQSLTLETAMLQANAGAADKAEALLSSDLLGRATGMEKARLYAMISIAYANAEALDKSRHYALMSLVSLVGSRGELAASEPAGAAADSVSRRNSQNQFFIGQIGGIIAPLLLQYELKKDAAGRDAFVKEAEAAVGDQSVWTGALVAAQGEVARRSKELAAINKAAPEWASHAWIGSEELSVEKLKGKVVLVDFFATWCRPCIIAFPHIRGWAEKFAKDGLVVVGLTNYQGRYEGASVQPEVELAKLRDDFMTKHKVTWIVGIEKTGRRTFDAYDVSGIPHMVLIDRKGQIRYTKTGASDYEKTEQMIQQLLAE